MRWFNLRVGKNLASPTFQLTNTNNVTPCNIEFEIQSFVAGGVNNSVAYIKCYVQGIEYYNELKSLKGLPVVLEAGAHSSPIAKAIGYSPKTNNVIYKGKIGAVMGNYSVINPYIYLGFEPLTPEAVLKLVNIKKGDFVFVGSSKTKNQIEADNLIDCLAAFFTEANIVVSDDLKKEIHTGNSNFTRDVRNVNEALALIEEFGGYAFYDAQSNIVFVVKNSSQKDVLKWQQEISLNLYNLRNSSSGGLASLAFFNLSKSKTISYNEIINQPVNMGFSGQVNLTTFLDAEIYLGREITLIGAGEKNGIISATASSLLSGGYLNAQSDKLQITKSGKYIITKVIHKGNFYGTSSDQWATSVEMIENKGIDFSTITF